jgi:chloramphenicol-sensitive protein RarD
VLLFHEPMPPARLAGFALVWVALIIFTVDGLRGARAAAKGRTAAASAAATAEPAAAVPPR